MKSIFFITLFISVLLLLSNSKAQNQISINEYTDSSSGHYKPGDFDFYLFVQQWIYTFCKQTKCDPTKERKAFTIHGLWPEFNNGSYPSFCAGSTFSIEDVSDLVNQLNLDWPSFSQPNINFWTNEWKKHGTCSIVGPITDIHSYFSAGLKLYSTYNITRSLEESEIYPSSTKTYYANQIVSALANNLGGTPAIQCSGGNLRAAVVCINKDTLEIMNCPKIKGFSCSGTIRIPDHS
eukprot:gene2280-2807_t